MSVKFKETVTQQATNVANGASNTFGGAAGGAANAFARAAQGDSDGKHRGPIKELGHEAAEFLTRGGGAKGYLQVRLYCVCSAWSQAA